MQVPSTLHYFALERGSRRKDRMGYLEKDLLWNITFYEIQWMIRTFLSVGTNHESREIDTKLSIEMLRFNIFVNNFHIIRCTLLQSNILFLLSWRAFAKFCSASQSLAVISQCWGLQTRSIANPTVTDYHFHPSIPCPGKKSKKNLWKHLEKIKNEDWVNSKVAGSRAVAEVPNFFFNSISQQPCPGVTKFSCFHNFEE